MTSHDDKIRVQMERFRADLPGFLLRDDLAGKWICYLDGLHYAGNKQTDAYRFGLEHYGLDGGFVIVQVVEQEPIPLHKLGAFGVENSDVTWSVPGKKPPSPEEEHERLRDAVIEAASRLQDMRVEWMDAVDAGDAPDDELPEEVTEQTDRVCDPVAALKEHERKAGG